MLGKISIKLGILNAMGQYYQPPPPYMQPPQRKSSGLATGGGICILISGIWTLINAIILLIFGELFFGDLYGLGDYDLSFIFTICGVISLIVAIFALLGGAMALTKKSWGLAIMGGIFAMLSVGGGVISCILGLIGLILVGVSRHDFEGHQQVPPQVVYVQQPQAPQQPMRLCMGCGRQIQDNYNVCPHCGRPSR